MKMKRTMSFFVVIVLLLGGLCFSSEVSAQEEASPIVKSEGETSANALSLLAVLSQALPFFPKE